MSTPAEDSITVRYSAKELFARIDNKLDQIVTKLDEKAENVELVALELRVATLEKTESERKGFGYGQRAILGALIVIAGLLVPIVRDFI